MKTKNRFASFMGFARARSSANEGEIRLYDVIGGDWYGGTPAKDFIAALDSLKGCKTINLYVNSPGGDVFEAMAIFNAIKRCDAKVVAHVDGLAASAASFILMACSEVRMPTTSMLMIHNPWGISIGESKDMRKYADELDKIGEVLRSAYVAKTGMKAADLQALLDAETWLTAEESKAKGFCDVLVTSDPDEDGDEEDDNDDDGDGKTKSMVHPLVAKYKNTPDSLRKEAGKSDVLLATMGKRVQQMVSGRKAK